MSADFWASYASGAIGILIGNRLDVLKVRAQASGGSTINLGPLDYTTNLERFTALFRGAAAPILGYGALNSILFMTFNRSLTLMDPSIFDYTKLAGVDLGKIWVAGAVGGLATFVVSAPSELIKCRAQLVVDGQDSSYGVLKDIWKHRGFRGFYFGGTITAVRDAIGYGWYFWSYELSKRLLLSRQPDPFIPPTAADVLISGGIAGVVTWVSIYPLDVIKTRLQTQPAWQPERQGLLPGAHANSRHVRTSVDVAREVWRTCGFAGFYRGVGICSLRAFVVNAVQVGAALSAGAKATDSAFSGMPMRGSWRSTPAQAKVYRICWNLCKAKQHNLRLIGWHDQPSAKSCSGHLRFLDGKSLSMLCLCRKCLRVRGIWRVVCARVPVVTSRPPLKKDHTSSILSLFCSSSRSRWRRLSVPKPTAASDIFCVCASSFSNRTLGRPSA